MNNENIKRLLGDCLIDLLKNNVDVVFENEDCIQDDDDGMLYHGFYNEEMILCCTKKSENIWIQTFAHEYCHFLQDKEHIKICRDYDKNKTIKVLSDWVCGKKEISLQRVKTACKIIRDSELDCEKRTVELLKKYDIVFNVDEYISSANAYIYFHNLIWKHRLWFKTPPTTVSEILEIMPTKFLSNYDRTPRKYEQLFMEYCT